LKKVGVGMALLQVKKEQKDIYTIIKTTSVGDGSCVGE